MEIHEKDFILKVGPGWRKAGLEYAAMRFREREETKRRILSIITLLAIATGFGMVFAPEGRETVAYVVAPIVYLLCLVLMGVSRFLIKTPVVEIKGEGTDES